jgi:hypothetical protein
MMRRARRRIAAWLLCSSVAAWAQTAALRTVHVFVALADNEHQGIVPVSAKLGNGEDAEHNLYWGSAYGVKTFFSHSPDWEWVRCSEKPQSGILERCFFKHRSASLYLIADAYRGIEIEQAILDFFDSAAGTGEQTLTVSAGSGELKLPVRGGANLVAYVGHDGLMDFQLPRLSHPNNNVHRDVVVLACASKQFFANGVRASGAYPVLWTTGLMAPEAYTLKSALDGWIAGESNQRIRDRAAGAYDKYQKCGLRAAYRLFATGW